MLYICTGPLLISFHSVLSKSVYMVSGIESPCGTGNKGMQQKGGGVKGVNMQGAVLWWFFHKLMKGVKLTHKG